MQLRTTYRNHRQLNGHTSLSQRDQRLVESLGLPISYYARALRVSRQAVSKGIRHDDDYFSSPDVSRIVEACKEGDAALYRHAVVTVRELYVADAERILAAVGEGLPVSRLDTSVPGEFKLVSGDLMGFMRDAAVCHQQLCSIISNFEEHRGGHLEFLIQKQDYRIVGKYRGLCHDDKKVSEVIADVDLSLIPTYLVRIEPTLTTTMFACTDEGFVTISRFEADRLYRTLMGINGAYGSELGEHD